MICRVNPDNPIQAAAARGCRFLAAAGRSRLQPLHRTPGPRCPGEAGISAEQGRIELLGQGYVGGEAPLVRILVTPSPRNGLRKPSQLMVDKLFIVPIAAMGAVMGQLEPQVLIELDLALRGWLEFP